MEQHPEANSTVNRTEEFVFQVCKKTCLSLWSCSNPFAQPGKELCDVLVVCDPHVIIISVKDISLNIEKQEAGYKRWKRKAVDASVAQIYGAEKSLASATYIKFKDGSHGLDLPPFAKRKIHRIAVAFGSEGNVPIQMGDFGKGFVHVMHEKSFFDLLSELNTITDLIDYLTAKEDFSSRCSIIMEGSEANLMALYLSRDRSFPFDADTMVIDDTLWSGLQEQPEWKRRKESDEPSYAWDKLIELLSDTKAKSVLGPQPKLTDIELTLRSMAYETRFARRILGSALREFLIGAKAKKLRSRMLVSPSGIIYVLAYFLPTDELQYRTSELALRCVAARKKVGDGKVVIGIGIGEYEPDKGSSSELVYMNLEPQDWLKFIQESEEALQVAGYFSESKAQDSHHEEYP